MASLLDAINANQQQALKPQAQTNETSGIASLLRAKSGKAGVAPSTAISNQQEQAANAQTNTGLAQATQAASLQNQGQQIQSQGIAQEQQNQLNNISQQRKQVVQEDQIKTAQTLQNLQQSKGKISADEYAAQLEQVGQNLRLSNNQYIDQLTREGDMQRLNTDLGFQEQLQYATFGDQQEIMQDILNKKSIVDSTTNTYNIALQKMDIDQAYAMFESAMDNEKKRAMWTALGGVMNAGIGGMMGMGGKGGGGGGDTAGKNKYNDGSGGGSAETMPEYDDDN